MAFFPPVGVHPAKIEVVNKKKEETSGHAILCMGMRPMVTSVPSDGVLDICRHLAGSSADKLRASNRSHDT
jgi:hypothetical protein